MLNLLSESRPEENELKSEAQFQRLLASYAGNPLTPKTPRAPSDRGRYPEEAGDDDDVAVQSEDDDDELRESLAFEYSTTTEAINISGRGTPAQSINGDDPYLWNPGSPVGSSYMDVDPVKTLFSLRVCAYIDLFPHSQVFSFGSPNMTPNSGPSSWRYTPPSTSSAVRSNKRKRAEISSLSLFPIAYLDLILQMMTDMIPTQQRRDGQYHHPCPPTCVGHHGYPSLSQYRFRCQIRPRHHRSSLRCKPILIRTLRFRDL